MSLHTTEAILEEYRTALRESIAGRLEKERDWDRFREIETEATRRIFDENAAWQSDHHARLAEARQIILRETHGDILHEPKRDDIKKIPDRKTLNAEAEKRVQKDHGDRKLAIRRDEIDRYKELRNAVRSRNRLKEDVPRAFEQARSRSGPSRN